MREISFFRIDKLGKFRTNRVVLKIENLDGGDLKWG